MFTCKSHKHDIINTQSHSCKHTRKIPNADWLNSINFTEPNALLIGRWAQDHTAHRQLLPSLASSLLVKQSTKTHPWYISNCHWLLVPPFASLLQNDKNYSSMGQKQTIQVILRLRSGSTIWHRGDWSKTVMSYQWPWKGSYLIFKLTEMKKGLITWN